MEGQVFACSWKKQRGGYRVWVKNRPKLSATGKTFPQADRRLWSVIMDATGDGENDRTYDPPEPEQEPALTPAASSDIAAWIAALSRERRQRRQPEPLKNTAAVARLFERRVREHFPFLGDLGFKGPTFSRKLHPLTGMWFEARYASKTRTVVIELGRAHKKYSNSASFQINRVPPVDFFELFDGTLYLATKKSALGNAIAEFDRTHTLDEIMVAQFPMYASLLRVELRQVLTGDQWHHEYDLHRER